MARKVWLVVAVLLVEQCSTELDDAWMHPSFDSSLFHKIHSRSAEPKTAEETAKFWENVGQAAVNERLQRTINQNIAKNVIMFLGDGMSIPTLAATRVYLGGEEKKLAFEDFPYTGFSKTYCVDKQVADSACSATAYLGGVKANYGTIGVTAAVKRKSCVDMINPENFVHSIAHSSQRAGKMTGLVTTARVTHASPAGVYAHTADRGWESDMDVLEDNEDPQMCTDIANQLVHGETGRKLNVIMGGGRTNFLPENSTDSDGVSNGRRKDGVNLLKKWQMLKMAAHESFKFVPDREQLLNLDFNKLDYLLGLFAPDHMDYNQDRDPNKEPSLAEMTYAAINMLKKARNGYFLFVEGARIDMAHHANKAHKALNETVEFSKAVQTAMDMTSEEDTLIVVTSDHAHTMSVSGYGPRGQDILGVGGMGIDDMPYSTLSYANGPSCKTDGPHKSNRILDHDLMGEKDFTFPSTIPLASETHGGDDVGIFASGPWSHLFTGTMEENAIPHLMSFASCVGTGAKACDSAKESSFIPVVSKN